jgi:hypothetical protein
MESRMPAGDVAYIKSGRCGCCGRELTDPESVWRGIGPVCREKDYFKVAWS